MLLLKLCSYDMGHPHPHLKNMVACLCRSGFLTPAIHLHCGRARSSCSGFHVQAPCDPPIRRTEKQIVAEGVDDFRTPTLVYDSDLT